MQVVIDMDTVDYEYIKNGCIIPIKIDNHIYDAIRKGTLLPKGHGRLIDSDKLDTRLNFVLNHTGEYKNTLIGTGIVIAMAENLDAPTVLDAEAESEE